MAEASMTTEDRPVVLIIDDEPLIHRLLTFKLRSDGLDFLTAETGEEGLERARRGSPALVLVDLSLPGIDGFEVIRRLKDDPVTMHIAVIVISASSESSDKVLAFDLGAMDYVSKPFDIHELRARIRSALSMRRLMEMLEKRAQIDALTGLWNRAYFSVRLADEIERARRNGSPLCLVMADLDHFKRVNDRHGHQGGDLVLQSFSSLVNATLRSCDVACRYGGEEFAIILPDTLPEDAVNVCQRIREQIADRTWPTYPGMHATVSMGVAMLDPVDITDASEWVAAADEALYQAKRTGRNRVRVFASDAPAAGDLRIAV